MVNSSVAVTGRARTTSDATTATFPIKRIVIDGQAQQKQPPQRQQTKKGKRPHQHHNDQNQHQQHQQQQQQQEPIDQARIEEAKKAAKLTAKLASRGIILSNHPNTGTSNPQKRNTVMPYLPNIPPVRGPPPIKKLRKTMKVNTKMKKKESKINDDKYQMQQNKPKTKRPATIQEEKREERGFDDDMSISFTSRTITTAPTNATTDNATSVVHWNVTTDGGTDANPSHKTFFPLSPKRMFQPKRQQQKEMQEFDQYQLNQQQMQLAQQQQKQKELREAQALLNSGAWTCGVCGKPFASLHDAESHELLCLVLWVKHDRRKSSKPQQQQHHIQQQYQNDVPQKQSVNKATKPAPSPTNSIATIPTISSNAGHTIKRFFREKTMSMDDTLTSHNKSQNADDPLSHSQMLAVTPTINLVSPFVSVTAAASAVAPRGKDIIGTCEDGQEQIQSRKLSWSTMSPTPLSYQPPHTRGEIALPSPTIQKYIVLTDDTAVKIARRARNVLFALCRQELFSYSNKNQHKNNNVSSSITSIQSAASIPLSSTDNTTPSSKSSNNDSASLLLLYQEFDAQRELVLLSRDRQYYSMLQQHSMGRQHEGQSNQYNYYYYHQYARMGILGDICSIKCEDDDDSGLLPVRIWKTVKYKFEHAYELIKEGPASRSCEDQYKESQDMSGKSGKSSGINSGMEMTHDRHTLYVNVVVKNSVQVVNNELQRMARGWWESTATTNGGTAGGRNKEERKGADTNEGKNVTTHKPTKDEILDFQFEWIRAHTQQKVIQLAGLALASDFTPRKVAIQLSNDLLRLMAPQLELRGVTIHTEIEYRAGPYFVLAVNVLEIDWILLMDHTRKMLVRQRRKWTRDQRIRKERSSTHVRSGADGSKKKKKKKLEHYLVSIRYHFPSRNEIVGQILAFMNRLHFIFAIPLLHIFYSIPFVSYAVNKFILTVVTDDIFRYVEKKGMEMQLEIKSTSNQASFMLAALREMREDDKKRKKKQGSSEFEDEDYKPILGPFLGPAIKEDKNEAKAPPEVSLPNALEFVGLEVDLPVGFLRLRWALLNSKSSFFKDAFLNDAMKYTDISLESWSSKEDEIGLPAVSEDSFLNATREYSYLMPKSAFVKANMCYATLELIHYSNYCFVVKEKTLTPEVPYGNTFVSWTQYSIINTGKDTCRMICSVEAEFPLGAPMVARQIKSGMRSGTAEKFMLLGETICRYADAFP